MIGKGQWPTRQDPLKARSPFLPPAEPPQQATPTTSRPPSQQLDRRALSPVFSPTAGLGLLLPTGSPHHGAPPSDAVVDQCRYPGPIEAGRIPEYSRAPGSPGAPHLLFHPRCNSSALQRTLQFFARLLNSSGWLAVGRGQFNRSPTPAGGRSEWDPFPRIPSPSRPAEAAAAVQRAAAAILNPQCATTWAVIDLAATGPAAVRARGVGNGQRAWNEMLASLLPCGGAGAAIVREPVQFTIAEWWPR